MCGYFTIPDDKPMFQKHFFGTNVRVIQEFNFLNPFHGCSYVWNCHERGIGIVFADVILTLLENSSPAYNGFWCQGRTFLLKAAKGQVNGKYKIVNPVTLTEQFLEAKVLLYFTFPGVIDWHKGKIDLFQKEGIDDVRDTVIKMYVCIRRVLECSPVSV